MKIVVAGGTGFLGRALTARLVADGHHVVVFSRAAAARNAGNGARTVAWTPNGESGPWAAELDGADAVVNLAGAGIADSRWTPARKRLLVDSRVLSTKSLAAAVQAARAKPGAFIHIAAIGIYGAHADGPAFDESGAPGTDFLARLCVAWEDAVQPVAEAGCRVVVMRNGVVLSRRGGALKKMLPAFQLFAGGRIASGRQVMSWIHVDDWVAMTLWAIGNPAVSGPVNATAPNPVPNGEFSRALGRALHRPSWAPVPGFVLNVLFGEMATDCLILGQRVMPRRALDLGFTFRFERIDEALADAVTHR